MTKMNTFVLQVLQEDRSQSIKVLAPVVTGPLSEHLSGSAKALNAALTALPALLQEHVEPQELRTVIREIQGLPCVEDGHGGRALVLQTLEQHNDAVDLFRRGKALREGMETALQPVDEAVKTIAVQKKALKDAILAFLQPSIAMVEQGILGYRARVAREAAERAKEQAKIDAKQQRKAQEAEAKRLEQEAAKAKTQDKRDLLAEAAAVRSQALPSVEGAAVLAAARAKAGFDEAPSSQYWHAEIDSIGRLAAAIVASSEELYQEATNLRAQRRRGEWTQVVPPEAAIGIARVKGQLQASPWLNQQARDLRENFRIPGVRAVSRDGVRNL